MNRLDVPLVALLLLITPSFATAQEAHPSRVAEQTMAAPGPNADRLPAWEWSREERVRERLNPRFQEERRKRAIAAGNTLGVDVTVISGSHEPELFLPEELFGVFVSEVLADDPRARGSWREEISSQYSGELPADFWTRFEEVARELQSLKASAKAIGRDATGLEGSERDRARLDLDLVEAERCSLFKRTLARSRKLLSPGEFDKLLYEGVAPNLVTQESTSASELMRRIERGC